MTPDTMKFTLTRPDDWHVHLRDGPALATTVPHTARCFARAIVMPNLKDPVTTTAAAAAYRERILAALAPGQDFQPLMTLYLTDDTGADEIKAAKDSGIVHGVKLYPAGATTNSQRGVTDLAKVYPVLEAMERHGLPLLIHGETTAPEVDIFDREKVFIEQTLAPLAHQFPGLRMVLEHITTEEAVDFVQGAPDQVAATITAHHLLLSRNDLLAGGLHAHHYCLPVLKRDHHRRALIDAAASGNPKFFLGTDSAPHARPAKESACGCAGIYSAPVAMELYAHIFEQAGALHQLEAFAGHYGSDFYRLPRNEGRLTLIHGDWTVPESMPFGDETVVPLWAGRQLDWQVA